MGKRICALALAVCIVFGFSASAYAETPMKNEAETVLKEQKTGGTENDAKDVEFERLETPEEAAAAVNGNGTALFSERRDETQAKAGESLNRIVLRSEETPEETYGARQGYYYVTGDEYILEYEDEDATEKAFELLSEIYGDDRVFLDDWISLADTSFETTDEQVLSEDTLYEQTASAFDGIHAMGLDTLRDKAEGTWNGEVKVAVIDSGVDTDHPQLAARIDADSIALAGSTLDDRNGHGTHVAGIISSATPSQVKLLAVRAFDDSDYATLTTIRYAIDYAVQAGAGVINLSIGENYAKASEKNLVDAALCSAVQKGIVVCAAAGNEYADVADCYPASSDWTIAVGALKESSPGVYEWDSYSNCGAALDFTAPGTNIVSTWKNGGLKSESGTSMACPHLSAAAAMVKLKHPEYDQWNTYTVFCSFSVDLGEIGRDDRYGYGYVNLSSYYEQESGDGPLVVVPEPEPVYESKPVEKITPKLTVKNKTVSIAAKPFYLKVKNSGTGKLTYQSSNPNVATIGKKGKVKVKSVGTTTITVKAAANSKYKSAVKKIKIKVNPAKATIKKLTKGRRSIRVYWKKKSYVTGYQIRYSTKSNMKNAKKATVKGKSNTSKKITGLKAKKVYYVQVRAYRKKAKKTYFGKWSAKKKVRVR